MLRIMARLNNELLCMVDEKEVSMSATEEEVTEKSVEEMQPAADVQAVAGEPLDGSEAPADGSEEEIAEPTEEEKEKLVQLEAERAVMNGEAEKHRQRRDELNAETKVWKAKRDELNGQVRALVDEAG